MEQVTTPQIAIVIPSTVLDVLAAEPDLHPFFAEAVKGETFRYSRHRAAVAPFQGACNGGCAPGPFTLATAEELLDQAREKMAERRAFLKSADGQFIDHMHKAFAAQRRVLEALVYVQDARCRGWDGERQKIADRLYEGNMASFEISATIAEMEKLAETAVNR